MKRAHHFSRRKEFINDEVDLLYHKLLAFMPGLCRMAVALYESESGVLHTFLKSPPDSQLLNHYTIPLEQVPSLLALAESSQVRVIDNMELSRSDSFHSLEVLEYGVKSSYTVPMYLGTDLLGFVFFDSKQAGYFDEHVTDILDVYSKLVEAMLAMDILPVRALMGMITSSCRFTQLKDQETGEHITRVSSYVEIIASEMAQDRSIIDETIEYMWLYAPLHDIGKIGVPDHILLKQGQLSDEEMVIMRLHVTKGIKIIEQMIKDFNFEHMHHTDILLNMVATHHERWDGLGYPKRLKGEAIPLEGRIMAVADVFDAMSSTRIYRESYSLSETFSYIKAHRGKRFDPRCVDALLSQEDKIRKVYESFKERGL